MNLLLKVKAEGIPALNGTMLEVQDLCNELGLDFKSYSAIMYQKLLLQCSKVTTNI